MLYSLTNSSANNQQQTTFTEVRGKQKFVVRGPKLKAKNSKNEVTFEKDKRLEIKVVKSAPLLKVIHCKSGKF